MSDSEGSGSANAGDSSGAETPPGPARDPDVEALLGQLEELEETVDSEQELEQVQSTISLAERIPGSGFLSGHIQKYTTRDVAEAVVGAILISMPMLVEDGVFDVAAYLTDRWMFGVPIFFALNVVFVVVMSIGLLYWADIREVKISNPIFGIVPRRLVGVLTASFLTATGLVFLWGRHRVGDPSDFEVLARIVVVWTAAAFGAALGDILPGESAGYDITIQNLDDIVKPEE